MEWQISRVNPLQLGRHNLFKCFHVKLFLCYCAMTKKTELLVIFRLRDSNITSFSDRHVNYIRLSYLKQL